MSLFYSNIFFVLSLIFGLISALLGLSGGWVFLEVNLFSFFGMSFVIPVALDLLSLFLLSVVMGITCCVLRFSKIYMSEDGNNKLLEMLIVCLVVSMCFLVLVPSVLGMVIGWDGLGLVSYLLVIFYPSYKAKSGGMLTLMTNRIGDGFLISAICMMMVKDCSFNMPFFSNIGCLKLAMVAAAMTKSAQFPFSSWLPAAMEAPTPVSALVHSSTLVAAGVWLVLRFGETFANEKIFAVLSLIGSLTSLFAGASACFENDLKKIVAFSTLSQLGFMFFSLGMKMLNLAFFHMVTHAIFKALLFICVGMIIHLSWHCQDIRFMGSVSNSMPVTTSATGVSVFSMNAIPLMSGFYSKDAIIESAMYSGVSFVSFMLCVASILATWFYCFRFVWLVYFSQQKNFCLSSFKEPVKFPMMVLGVGSILAGSAFSSFTGPHLLESLSPFVKALMMLIPVIAFFSFFSCLSSVKTPMKNPFKLSQICNMHLLVPLSSQAPLASLSYISSAVRKLDQSWFEVGQVSVLKEIFKLKDISFFMVGCAVVVVVFCLL